MIMGFIIVCWGYNIIYNTFFQPANVGILLKYIVGINREKISKKLTYYWTQRRFVSTPTESLLRPRYRTAAPAVAPVSSASSTAVAMAATWSNHSDGGFNFVVNAHVVLFYYTTVGRFFEWFYLRQNAIALALSTSLTTVDLFILSLYILLYERPSMRDFR